MILISTRGAECKNYDKDWTGLVKKKMLQGQQDVMLKCYLIILWIVLTSVVEETIEEMV